MRRPLIHRDGIFPRVTFFLKCQPREIALLTGLPNPFPQKPWQCVPQKTWNAQAWGRGNLLPIRLGWVVPSHTLPQERTLRRLWRPLTGIRKRLHAVMWGARRLHETPTGLFLAPRRPVTLRLTHGRLPWTLQCPFSSQIKTLRKLFRQHCSRPTVC